MTTTTEPRREVVILEPVNRAQLDAERNAIVDDATSALPPDIVSPQEYAAIADLDARLSAFIAKYEPVFDEHCAAAHRVWKQATDIRAMFFDGPRKLKARARELLGRYKAKQDQIRRDEERRIAEEQHRAEQDRIRAEAKLLEKQGQPEIAAAVRAQPVHAPAVVLPDVVPDVGLAYREDFYWEPVGGDTPTNRARALTLLVRADYAPFLKFDDGALTAFARRTKGTIRIPGIVFRSKQIPVRR
jgi:hypothetical protein